MLHEAHRVGACIGRGDELERVGIFSIRARVASGVVGRLLPSELTGAPCIGRMASPIVVPVVNGMDSAGHNMVVVVATELFATEDGSSSVDIDVV